MLVIALISLLFSFQLHGEFWWIPTKLHNKIAFGWL